jgi:transposase
MKLQDVILKAMAKKISWMEAAEIAGVTDRTMRRIRERYEEFGYTGLFDQRRGNRSRHWIPMATAEEVLRLYREVYFDFNIRHFDEKLREEHEIRLSYTWVQQALDDWRSRADQLVCDTSPGIGLRSGSAGLWRKFESELVGAGFQVTDTTLQILLFIGLCALIDIGLSPP